MSILVTSRIHCTDSRDLRGDGFTDPEPRTGYEPNRTVDNPIVTEQEIEHSAEESQIPEIEDKLSLPYNQSLLSSTQVCFAVPQAALASPRYLPERVANTERSHIYHSERGLLSSSSQSLNFVGTGKPVAWLSHQKDWVKTIFRVAKSLLEEIEITCFLKRDLN